MTKKLTEQLTLLLLTLLFSSCDRWAHYQFQIFNALQKPITVTFIDRDTDSLHTVILNAGDSTILLTTLSENLGLNEKPHGVWLRTDTFTRFNKLQMAVDSIIIKKDFRLTKMWTYTAVSKDLGIYKLQVSSSYNY